jgi:hypothetical protein
MEKRKNCWVIPTDKPSSLFKDINGNLSFNKDWVEIPIGRINHNIYITSDEEIKDEDWCYDKVLNIRFKTDNHTDFNYVNQTDNVIKIILTTDPDLIEDGIQAIDDEFLEWFVKNPTCEWVRIAERFINKDYDSAYVIIIPKEEPNPFELPKALPDDVFYKSLNPKQSVEEYKQQCLDETLEEAAEINCESITHPYCHREKSMFIKGAKWQAERMYSEEEVFELITNCLLATGKTIKAEMKNIRTNDAYIEFSGSDLKEWFEQNKK